MRSHDAARNRVRGGSVFWALLALLAAGPLTACDDEGGGPSLMLDVPSPEWSDQVIYFVMIDRFEDGDPTNNDQGAGEYDPTVNSHYSGGDLQGIIDRLDYIQGLGATAIWITPPVANQWWDPQAEFSGYHGYWARNFKQVDEHYGTLRTYRELSDALHQRGMYLIQDIVTNHTGNFFYYDGAYDPEDPTLNFTLNAGSLPTAAPTQSPFDMNDVNDPADREASIFHWTPAISDYNDPVQELTYQISGLDDLDTANPVVRQALRDSYGYWIREVGVDGFRIDTVKFVEHEFFNDFIHATDADTPGIDGAAAETGRDDFLTFGEVYEVSQPYENSAEVKATSYLGTEASPELSAVLEFPLYEELGRVLAEGNPTDYLTYRLEQLMDRSLFRDPTITPTFIDNHDTQRFLQGGSEAAFRQALTVMMTIPGIPVIYYGTEQGFDETRAAMFAEGWMSGGGDHFDTSSDWYLLVRDLIALRTSHRVFTRGDLEIVDDSPAGPGVFAYTRSLDDVDALVLLNTADERILVNGLDTGALAGTVFEVLHREGFEGDINAGADGLLLAELPARTDLVLLATDQTVSVPEPEATIEVDTEIAGETFVDDVTVTGTVDPADTDLAMVLNGYLDRATEIDVAGDGTWTVVIPVSLFPYGELEHTVTFYAPDAEAATPPMTFTSDVEFDGVIVTVEDPEGDDTGPEGTYTYPTDTSFAGGGTMDILKLDVEAGPTILNLKFTMAEWTDVWNPNNGFDHVSFNVYFDVPGVEGLTMLPKIDGTAPEGFAWDFMHFAFGWANGLYETAGASETSWGTPVTGAPTITVDGPNRLIVFTYDRSSFDIDSWDGVSIYATTWDFDGIDNIYRNLTSAGGPYTMGGGDQGDPKIMDDVGPVEIPAE